MKLRIARKILLRYKTERGGSWPLVPVTPKDTAERWPTFVAACRRWNNHVRVTRKRLVSTTTWSCTTWQPGGDVTAWVQELKREVVP